jgi:hypothetical protein
MYTMDDVIVSFPGTIVSDDDNILVPIYGNIMMSVKFDCSDCVVWDDKGTDYTEKISNAIDDLTVIPHNDRDKLLIFLQHFRDSVSINNIAGMECGDESLIDMRPYDGSKDPIWKKMEIKFNVKVSRYLKIITYGTVYIFEKPKTCQTVFNASKLRGGQDRKSVSYKMLIKLRGTDTRIQQDVRNAELFEKFINEIVCDVETNNLNTIAIICRAGHHRSVACAEMLKHLYKNAITEHMTIDN